MIFDWDDEKAKANVEKHGVTFEEASTVFGDPLAITYADPGHSTDEERFLTFGMSDSQRLLIVSHVDMPDGVRIINARSMTRMERKIYEEG